MGLQVVHGQGAILAAENGIFISPRTGEGPFMVEGLSVISVCEGLCLIPPAPPQQLQLSAEAFARSFLSSLIGSGNSL